MDLHRRLYKSRMDVPTLHRFLFESFLDPGTRSRLIRAGYLPEQGFESLRKRELPPAPVRRGTQRGDAAIQEGISRARQGVTRFAWDLKAVAEHSTETSEVRDAALGYLKELEIRL